MEDTQYFLFASNDITILDRSYTEKKKKKKKKRKKAPIGRPTANFLLYGHTDICFKSAVFSPHWNTGAIEGGSSPQESHSYFITSLYFLLLLL